LKSFLFNFVFLLIQAQIPQKSKKENATEDSTMRLIACENLETIEWIEEKIYSAISYYNETKGVFGSLDDV
jgi:hypothetical protein